MLQQYKIDYTRNPLEAWNGLKTSPPVDKKDYDGLFDFCKASSGYHFDETVDDIAGLTGDFPAVIPIKRFSGDWDDAVKELSQHVVPATFDIRKKPRMQTNNDFEEHDFRQAGYDIDGGYAPVSRIWRPELHGALQEIVDAFGFDFSQPGNVKFDVQMPGQVFYWHLDNFGGLLQRWRGDHDIAAKVDYDQRLMMRAIVFLDDQQLGHHWQHGNLSVHWQRGDCIAWPWRDIPHGTANYGHHPRPVLNVTGMVNDTTRELLTRGNS